MKALVIDDSRAMRMVLKRFVTKLGFEVSEAGDGRAAHPVCGAKTGRR